MRKGIFDIVKEYLEQTDTTLTDIDRSKNNDQNTTSVSGRKSARRGLFDVFRDTEDIEKRIKKFTDRTTRKVVVTNQEDKLDGLTEIKGEYRKARFNLIVKEHDERSQILENQLAELKELMDRQEADLEQRLEYQLKEEKQFFERMDHDLKSRSFTETWQKDNAIQHMNNEFRQISDRHRNDEEQILNRNREEFRQALDKYRREFDMRLNDFAHNLRILSDDQRKEIEQTINQ